MTHPVNLPLQLLIGVHRTVFDEVLIAFDSTKGMTPSVFRVLCRLHQVVQHRPLQQLTLCLMLFQSPHTGLENKSY